MRKDKLIKLNVGCGREIKEGWINLDIVKGKGVDVAHNLEKFPYPFKDNELDIVFASQILEHISNLDGVMKEFSRILKSGGKLIIEVPHFTSNSSYMDPTHKRFFAYSTFDFFVKGNNKELKYD